MNNKRPLNKAKRKAHGAIRFGIDRVPQMLSDSLRDGSDPIAADPRCTPVDLSPITEHTYAAAWLGHATLLLRQSHRTVLVDPVLTSRIGPRLAKRTIGPTRLAPCPITPAHLPPIDLILITHAHFDHLDKPTLEALVNPNTTLITAKRTKKLIPEGFARIIELPNDHSLQLDDLTITAIKPAHWGSRSGIDIPRGCNSYLLKSDDRATLLPGDTAATDAFDNLGPVDLAAFGIGAYEPSDHHHATPEQVWDMFTRIPGKTLLPIHHSTFELSSEHIDEPLDRLLKAAGSQAHAVAVVQPGQLWRPAP